MERHEVKKIEAYIEKFTQGTHYVNIASAVTQKELYRVSAVSDYYLKKQCVKLIPASGAATRMFKDLYAFLDDEESTLFIERFFEQLEHFAFYDDLKCSFEGKTMDKNTTAGRLKIVSSILDSCLKYGNKPKALIKMHNYEGCATTPIDEHIFEGEQYLNSNLVDLHFTISKEHEILFNQYVAQALQDKDNIRITYSFQKNETHTPAVDMDNNPFHLANGDILYRPGGHGALLENLNNIDADIVFIKNIDNVCHRSRIEDTIESKKMLASAGLEAQEKVNWYINDLLADDYDLEEIGRFINDVLKITLKTAVTKEKAFELLNRPIRVCGVVKNTGAPGGGPFIVDNGDYLDLQICESAEIDLADATKLKIYNEAEYFNPVDIVCFVRDYKGDKFDLRNFSNADRYFITEKTYHGTKIKALEHPGLWNGAMHHWNTLFVEVPLSTFNPVKTVNDLLEEGHMERSVVTSIQ